MSNDALADKYLATQNDYERAKTARDQVVEEIVAQVKAENPGKDRGTVHLKGNEKDIVVVLKTRTVFSDKLAVQTIATQLDNAEELFSVSISEKAALREYVDNPSNPFAAELASLRQELEATPTITIKRLS